MDSRVRLDTTRSGAKAIDEAAERRVVQALRDHVPSSQIRARFGIGPVRLFAIASAHGIDLKARRAAMALGEIPVAPLKTCAFCGATKPSTPENFPPHAGAKRGRRCATCIADRDALVAARDTEEAGS